MYLCLLIFSPSYLFSLYYGHTLFFLFFLSFLKFFPCSFSSFYCRSLLYCLSFFPSTECLLSFPFLFFPIYIFSVHMSSFFHISFLKSASLFFLISVFQCVSHFSSFLPYLRVCLSLFLSLPLSRLNLSNSVHKYTVIFNMYSITSSLSTVCSIYCTSVSSLVWIPLNLVKGTVAGDFRHLFGSRNLETQPGLHMIGINGIVELCKRIFSIKRKIWA